MSRRLQLGCVAIIENGQEVISLNDAFIHIGNPAAESGDDETEIEIKTTNFSALALAQQIVDRFNAGEAS